MKLLPRITEGVEVGPCGVNMGKFSDAQSRHIGRALTRQAEELGDAPFLLSEVGAMSFAEVNARVNRIAAGLANHGVGRGDHVAFFMNSDMKVILFALAASKLGAVWIPINGDYKGEWLTDSINRSRPKVLLTDSEHFQRVAEIRDALDPVTFVLADSNERDGEGGVFGWDALLADEAAEPDQSAFTNLDPSAVLWTSGTTGKSKGVIQSHNVWFHAAGSASTIFRDGPGDVIYCVLPMYNSAAWVTSIFRALFSGLPLAVDPRFSVSTFWDRVDHFGATQCMTLGAMHMFLWNAPEKPDDGDHKLERLLAVPMPADIAGPFAERFQVELLPSGLGQSESMVMSTHYPQSDEQMPPGSCGRIVEGFQGRIVKEDGEDAGTGEPGELWLQPEMEGLIFSGYLDQPEANEAAFSDGWYKTGDLVRRDEEGFLYFVDRKKDAVRYKGRNISTFEVEYVARKHPAVSDCAAFGVQSEELADESELKLNIVLREGADLEPEQMARFIDENAPYFFVPRYIEIVESLPYTPTNKVQKFKLRELGAGDAWDMRQSDFSPSR